jgi:predicted transposase YdaD
MISREELAREDRKAEIGAGVIRGRKEGREEVAQAALLEGQPLETIATITDLDIAQIKRLQTELN